LRFRLFVITLHDLARIRIRTNIHASVVGLLKDMMKWGLKIVLVVALTILCIGTALADIAPSKSAKSTRELVEQGKTVGTHRIIKSGDPELIYSEGIKYYELQKWKKASDLFDACQAYYAGSMREDSIAFFAARSKFKNRDYSTSTVQLEEFRRKFGRSTFLEDAEAMLAMCNYYLAPGPTRDQTITSQAIISFTEFMERYPKSERNEAFSNLTEELTNRLKQKVYINAYTYFKIQRYKSAIVAFRNALKQFPETPYREDILYHIAVSCYRLAHNSVPEKQADRYLDTIDAYYSFIDEFPESKRCKELERYNKEAKNFMDKNNIEKQK